MPTTRSRPSRPAPAWSLAAEFAAGMPAGFPRVIVCQHACDGRAGERCVASCPPGMRAISGGHDRPDGRMGLAYPVDAVTWGVTLREDAAARPVTVWVMCI